jgi:dolichol-phosphate mannosyltransferase
MKSATKLVCIVVPCFNEDEVIAHTHDRIAKVLDDLPSVRGLIYYVDDGSTDTTLYRLNSLARRDERVRVISFSRNFGHQAALAAGLDLADPNADALLVMDGDLENPPELLPKMLDVLERGHDVVMGVRDGEREVGLWKRLASRGFYWLFNRLSDVPIQPGAPDFVLLSRRAREAVGRMPERHRFLRGMVTWIGFPRAYVPYVPPAREAGRSKYTLGHMLRFASDAIFSFSLSPLRLLTRCGLLLTALGVLGMTGAAALWLNGAEISLAAVILGACAGCAGVQLVGLGLLGGYIARAFQESQGRPLYVLQQTPHEAQRTLEAVPLPMQGRRAGSA